jgi:hypothetical protein
MVNPGEQWDFFLAHTSADEQAAEQLYELLSPYSKVFLDKRSLKYGDNWDQELAKAQRASRVTVVLVSSRTDNAYYEREEIAAAIDMARRDPASHRVVPVFLGDVSSIPYGLRLKHAITIAGPEVLANAARSLLELMAESQGRKAPAAPRTFDKVWYLPDENRWADLNPVAFNDVGRLIVHSDSIVFQGRHETVVITQIRRVSYGKQGRDFVNNWVKIEYGDGPTLSTAFFADGSLLGWGGVLGGNKRILRAVRHLALELPAAGHQQEPS